ncbi:MAG TPA: hypothetical protein PLI57_05015 [Spirochaetota bacterium]|nr:hypothetical protein [Spirochaetota bacterium]
MCIVVIKQTKSFVLLTIYLSGGNRILQHSIRNNMHLNNKILEPDDLEKAVKKANDKFGRLSSAQKEQVVQQVLGLINQDMLLSRGQDEPFSRIVTHFRLINPYLMQVEKYNEVNRISEYILNAESNVWDVVEVAAFSAFFSNNYELAEGYFSKLIHNYPEHLEYRTILGKILIELCRYDEAKIEMEKLLRTNAVSAQVLEVLVAACNALCDYDNAIKYGNMYLKYNKNNPQIYAEIYSAEYNGPYMDALTKRKKSSPQQLLIDSLMGDWENEKIFTDLPKKEIEHMLQLGRKYEKKFSRWKNNDAAFSSYYWIILHIFSLVYFDYYKITKNVTYIKKAEDNIKKAFCILNRHPELVREKQISQNLQNKISDFTTKL